MCVCNSGTVDDNNSWMMLPNFGRNNRERPKKLGFFYSLKNNPPWILVGLVDAIGWFIIFFILQAFDLSNNFPKKKRVFPNGKD